MAAANSAALIAYGQLPAPTQATAAQHFAAIFCTHTIQEAVFASAWNSFRLPGSFRHGIEGFLCFFAPGREERNFATDSQNYTHSEATMSNAGVV